MSEDDQGPLMLGSVAAALFSAMISTAARLYCSVVLLNRTRREDAVILISLVSLLYTGAATPTHSLVAAVDAPES